MINLVLPVPHDRLVPLHVPNAGFLVLEGLYLKEGDFDRAHVLVDQSDLEFLLV